MDFNRHPRLEGLHAFLTPSKYSWVNYDDEKLAAAFFRSEAARRGTEFHELAHRLIKLGVKLPDVNRTLNMYVNDAIGYRMVSEQALYFSPNCFGTADTIKFSNNKLRVHDLKMGEREASMKQLEVYVALFCLEYAYGPTAIEIETRIYQNDDVVIHTPDPDDIFHIMDRIITFDKQLNNLRKETM